MNSRKLAISLSIAVAGAFAGPALADQVIEVYTAPATQDYYYVPSISDSYVISPTDDYHAPLASDAYVVPVPQDYTTTTVYYDEPPIVVTAPRPSDDAVIASEVVDRIASDPYVEGNIGVDSFRGRVDLTGRVATTNQVERAETDARGVDGVVDVNNYLRARVGDE